MKDMGCYEISLGDTIGVGTPGKHTVTMATKCTYPIQLYNGFTCIEIDVQSLCILYLVQHVYMYLQ